MADVAQAAAAEIAGEENRCPHCRGLTRLEEHAFYRWVCGACGGPRVPASDGRVVSERATSELVRANSARKQAFVARLAAIGLALTGTLTAALGLLLTLASTVVGLMILATAAALLVASVMIGARSRRQSEQARRLTFEAWESIAEKVVELHGGTLTGPELAKKLHTTEADVERMMSFLSVDDRVRIDVGPDAEVRYTTAARIALVPDTSGPAAGAAETVDANAGDESEGPAARGATPRG